MKKLEEYVRSIPDFPEKGIIFRDITTVIQDPNGFHLAIDAMIEKVKDLDFDLVVGKGKLPCETVCASYELEYGTAEIELHKDSIAKGQKVIIVDDLIATGGTVEACAKLVEELGGIVEKIVFLLELAGLHGRDKLEAYDVASVITYEGK